MLHHHADFESWKFPGKLITASTILPNWSRQWPCSYLYPLSTHHSPCSATHVHQGPLSQPWFHQSWQPHLECQDMKQFFVQLGVIFHRSFPKFTHFFVVEERFDIGLAASRIWQSCGHLVKMHISLKKQLKMFLLPFFIPTWTRSNVAVAVAYLPYHIHYMHSHVPKILIALCGS